MAKRNSSLEPPLVRRQADHLEADVAAPDSDQSARSWPRLAGAIQGQPEREQEGPVPDVCLLDEILGRFSDALALVETAHLALEKAQEDECPIGAAVLTLHRGIEELKGAHTEFDLTFAHIRRRGGGT